MNPLAHNLFLRIADPVERLDAMEKYEERAAVAEFDGKQTREAAEALALSELTAKAKGRLHE